MKNLASETQPEYKIGDITEAEVYKITNFGAFVKLPYNKRALLHISQISDDFVENISEHLKIGDRIKARVIAAEGPKIELSLKKLKEYISSYPKDKEFKSTDLEEKLKVFLKK